METASLCDLAASVFADLGADTDLLSHSFLLRANGFAGHRFRCGDLQATWLLGSDAMGFFGADGELLRSVAIEPRQEEGRAKAA